MTREEMIQKLTDIFQNSDEESIMLAAEAKENPDGTYDLRITEGDENELFTMHSELGQTIGELRSSFKVLMNEAVQSLIGEQIQFQDTNPAEL